MRVQLDREKKIVLIQALKRGYIDSNDVDEWFDTSDLPIEELEKELTRLQRIFYPDTCRRLKREGLCVDCNRRDGVVVNGYRLDKTTEEIPN